MRTIKNYILYFLGFIVILCDLCLFGLAGYCKLYVEKINQPSKAQDTIKSQVKFNTESGRCEPM